MVVLEDYKEKMLSKIDECDKWLNSKDIACEKLENAKKELEVAKLNLENAEKDVTDYTEENINNVINYKNELKAKLGIVDEVIEEPVEEEHIGMN